MTRGDGLIRRSQSPLPFSGRPEGSRILSAPCKFVIKGKLPCWSPARSNGLCWSHRHEAEKEAK